MENQTGQQSTSQLPKLIILEASHIKNSKENTQANWKTKTHTDYPRPKLEPSHLPKINHTQQTTEQKIKDWKY